MNSEAMIAFFAGMLVQAVFLLLGKLEPKDLVIILLCCAGSALGLIPGKHEHNYDFSFHLFIAACVFAVAYAYIFKEKILERINKEIVMVWTLVGLYIALGFPFIVSHQQLTFLLLALSLLPIVNAFADFDQSYGWKVYFYIWFLCLIVGVMISQFAFSTVSAVFGFGHHTVPINPLTIFVIGMSFLYLAVNLWYVLEIIPISGEKQSFDERMEEVEEDLEMFAANYDADQVRSWKTLVVFILCVSLLAANYFRHFISDTVLIPLLIAMLPVLNKSNFSKVPALSVTEPAEETATPEAEDKP